MIKKTFYIFILFSAILYARENPFVATKTSSTIGKTTIIKDTRADFVAQTINLPSSVRILKSVELHYQNLDGSIKSKIVQIDAKIDWHNKLVLKNSKDEKMIKVETKVQNINKDEPTKTTISFKDFISFDIRNNIIKINTKDKKLRDFLVTNPYKIILDFQREASFYTKVFDLNITKFRSITIGKHDRYYRIAIELDGQYTYTLSQDDKYITIKLK